MGLAPSGPQGGHFLFTASSSGLIDPNLNPEHKLVKLLHC
jgi:hypothetical protein